MQSSDEVEVFTPRVTAKLLPTGKWLQRQCSVSQLCDSFRAGQLDGTTIVFVKATDVTDALIETFGIPPSFWDQVHLEASGFFEASETVSDQGKLQSYHTSFRLLIKSPTSPPPDVAHIPAAIPYTWHYAAFWSSWKPSGSSLLLCFEDPPILRRQVAEHLLSSEPNMSSAKVQERTISAATPFAMHAYFLAHTTHCFDSAVWAWRRYVRSIEKIRPTVAKPRPSQQFYDQLHELARHTTHTTETLTTVLGVITAMVDEDMHAPVVDSNLAPHRAAIRGLKGQRSLLHCLQERSRALESRLQSETTIAYHVNAQHDTNIAARIAEATQLDSTAMKTISILGLVFLPGTFISAIFSMSFFNFQPDNGDSPQRWVVSNRFWIYWVVTIPITAMTVAFWHFWQRSAKISIRNFTNGSLSPSSTCQDHDVNVDHAIKTGKWTTMVRTRVRDLGSSHRGVGV